MAKHHNKQAPHAVTFYSYPKLLFCWPLIAIGLLFRLIPESLANLEVMGWFYLLTVVMVILAVGVDIERNTAVFWLVVFGFFYFLGLWFQEAKSFTFFGNIYNWFANRDVQYNQSFGLVLSIFLIFPYAAMIIWARLQHKWRITHNEFEHFSFGRSDDSLARGAKRVRSTYPDLLELLLCGAGTLIVYSATGRTELRRIQHVPLLPLLRRRVDRILEMTAVTTTDAVIDEETEAEAEEASASPEPESETGDMDQENL